LSTEKQLSLCEFN